MTQIKNTTQPVIELSKLCKSYKNDFVQTLALQDVDLVVYQGEFISVMGPSGCGKSTLMSVLGLLDSYDSGTYELNGIQTESLDIDQRAKIRNKHIGIVFQSFNLIDSLTVAQNIAMPLQYQKVSKKETNKRVLQVLEQVNLTSRARHLPAQLSGGQQQRVAIARALVTQPDVLLVDEPTGNLDSKNGDQVMRLLVDLNRQGSTIIMVTHDARYSQCATRQVQLVDGKVAMENRQETREVLHAVN